MKNIKDLKEQYNNIVESESKEERKLTTLVRSGLFDAKKLPALKRAMDKPTEKMTPAEKKILIDLLDSLINQVVSSDQVYGKVKRNVQDMHEELKIDEPVTIKQVPTIVVFKRRAVRVYPGGRQVGLYYSYQLDKYITIPFGDAGLAMESVNPGTTGVSTRTPKPKKKKQILPADVRNRRDKIDAEIEGKNFDTLSDAERKRVSTGKVFGRAVRQGKKKSVIAAKTITAFLLNRKAKKSGTKPSSGSTNPLSTSGKATAKVQSTQKSVKPKVKVNFNLKLNKPKTTSVSAAHQGTMAGKIKGLTTEDTFKKKLHIIRESKQYDESQQLDEIAPLIAAAGGALARIAGGAALRGLIGTAGRAVAKKGLSKGTRLTRGLVKARKLARSASRLVGDGSDTENSNDSNNSSSDEKPDRTIKHSHQSTLKVSVGGPDYKQHGGALERQRDILNRKSSQAMLQREEIELDGNQFVINKNMAEKIVGVYNSLNEENKKIMISMLNDKNNQQKIYEFVARY